MARPLRIEYEGAFYHVIQRGIERKNIFASDSDKEKFLSYLNSCYQSYGAIFHAYVLMDNHYHLIIETPQANLSKIMHYIGTSYAIYFNIRHKRVGPLYQGRFKAVLVQQDKYLHHLSCYVYLNPVRAGIVKLPEEYPYSSYDYFISKKGPPKWLNTKYMLSLFDEDMPKAKRIFKQFVTSNIGKEKGVIDNNMKNGFVLGDENFFQSVRNNLIHMKENPEIPMLRDAKRSPEPPLERIKNAVGKYLKNDRRLMRSVSMYLSRKYTQRTLNEIAAFYGGIQYSGISQAWRRIENRKGKDKDFDKLLVTIESEVKSD